MNGGREFGKNSKKDKRKAKQNLFRSYQDTDTPAVFVENHPLGGCFSQPREITTWGSSATSCECNPTRPEGSFCEFGDKVCKSVTGFKHRMVVNVHRDMQVCNTGNSRTLYDCQMSKIEEVLLLKSCILMCRVPQENCSDHVTA